MATGHTVNYRLLELTNLRVLGLDQAELDRLACCALSHSHRDRRVADELEDS